MSYFEGSGLLGGERAKSAAAYKVTVRPFLGQWKPKQPLPSIRMQEPKSVHERLAEAEAFRGKIKKHALEEIRTAIINSARDFGEIPANIDPLVWQIQAAVAARFGLLDSDVRGRRRFRRVAIPRHIAMYLARVLTSLSLTEIGRQFSGQDHTTVLYGIKKIERLIEDDAAVAADVAALKAVLLA